MKKCHEYFKSGFYKFVDSVHLLMAYGKMRGDREKTQCLTSSIITTILLNKQNLHNKGEAQQTKKVGSAYVRFRARHTGAWIQTSAGS